MLKDREDRDRKSVVNTKRKEKIPQTNEQSMVDAIIIYIDADIFDYYHHQKK